MDILIIKSATVYHQCSITETRDGWHYLSSINDSFEHDDRVLFVIDNGVGCGAIHKIDDENLEKWILVDDNFD